MESSYQYDANSGTHQIGVPTVIYQSNNCVVQIRGDTSNGWFTDHGTYYSINAGGASEATYNFEIYTTYPGSCDEVFAFTITIGQTCDLDITIEDQLASVDFQYTIGASAEYFEVPVKYAGNCQTTCTIKLYSPFSWFTLTGNYLRIYTADVE